MKTLISKSFTAILAILCVIFIQSPEAEAGWLKKVDTYDCHLHKTGYSIMSSLIKTDEYNDESLIITYEYSLSEVSYKPISITLETGPLMIDKNILEAKINIEYQNNQIKATVQKTNADGNMSQNFNFNEKTGNIRARFDISDKNFISYWYFNGKCTKK